MTELTGQNAAAHTSVGYEPPRIEELGTVEELTMGFAFPANPDDTITFGTVSDRRLKHRIAPADTRLVLERVVSATTHS